MRRTSEEYHSRREHSNRGFLFSPRIDAAIDRAIVAALWAAIAYFATRLLLLWGWI